MRKLASIQEVTGIKSIDGADNIELVMVQGWQVVASKNEHKQGDLVVFYEIDSFLPAADERYAFLEPRFTLWNGKRGMRLKTIKLRKQLSQGLVMPVGKFPEIKNPKVGDDVTELLKIEKWEVVEVNSTNTQGARKFPSFIRKTDQERCQNMGNLIAEKLDENFEVTIKKDGSSMTAFIVQPDSKYYEEAKRYQKENLAWFEKVKKTILSFFRSIEEEPVIGICSRNLMLKYEGDSNFHRAFKKYDLENVLKGFGNRSLAIQGELVAPDIQKNYEKVSEIEFHVFDIFDIDQQRYMTPGERKNTIGGFGFVPQVNKISENKSLREILNFKEGEDLVQKLLDYAEGPGDNPGVKREGLVFKQTDGSFSFKAISNSYLLKQE